ncbi:MAG: hypothetical protein CSA38_01920 [Flavobacteriales bacterium]|nr:MAG: hypothetical protein CSA38_01920 [Flavobacteriales bacterium]
MKKQLELSPELQGLLTAINNVPNYWAKFDLEPLTDLPQFNRSLLVVGFSAVPVEKDKSEFFTVKVTQVFTKENGEVLTTKHEREWHIYAKDTINLTDGKGKEIKVMEKTLDEDGNLVEEKEINLEAPSIKHIKFLLLNKEAHLVDILGQFMGLYYNKFKNEIDRL